MLFDEARLRDLAALAHRGQGRRIAAPTLDTFAPPSEVRWVAQFSPYHTVPRHTNPAGTSNRRPPVGSGTIPASGMPVACGPCGAEGVSGWVGTERAGARPSTSRSRASVFSANIRYAYATSALRPSSAEAGLRPRYSPTAPFRFAVSAPGDTDEGGPITGHTVLLTLLANDPEEVSFPFNRNKARHFGTRANLDGLFAPVREVG